MKTSLIINDELYRQVKAKAALEGRKLTELIEEGLRHVLSGATAAQTKSKAPRRVQLPLMRVRPGEKPLFEGMSVDAIHERLGKLQESAERESDEASLRQ